MPDSLTLLGDVLLSSVGFLLVFMAIGIPIKAALLRRLREVHPALWVQLGRPTTNNRMSTYRAQAELLKWLRTRQFNSLDDESTRRLASRLRLFNRALMVSIYVISAAIFGAMYLARNR